MADILELTEQSSGKKFSIPAGSQVELKLKGNATTGYSWGISCAEPLEVEEATYTPDEPGSIGGGGTSVFRFRAIGRGYAGIKGTYCRPWEKAQPEPQFHVTIDAG